MCDYSLMAVPNRLAREGEELVSHRFPTGSLGLASPADLKRASDPPLHRRKSFLRSVMEFFDPPRAVPVPAVCIPPGARLQVQDIPTRIQKELGVEATEVVTFTFGTAGVRAPLALIGRLERSRVLGARPLVVCLVGGGCATLGKA